MGEARTYRDRACGENRRNPPCDRSTSSGICERGQWFRATSAHHRRLTAGPQGSEPQRPPIQHMRVHHRRAHVRVPEQLLHRPDVVPSSSGVYAVGEPRPPREVRSFRRSGTALCFEHGAQAFVAPRTSPIRAFTSFLTSADDGWRVSGNLIVPVDVL